MQGGREEKVTQEGTRGEEERVPGVVVAGAHAMEAQSVHVIWVSKKSRAPYITSESLGLLLGASDSLRYREALCGCRKLLYYYGMQKPRNAEGGMTM